MLSRISRQPGSALPNSHNHQLWTSFQFVLEPESHLRIYFHDATGDVAARNLRKGNFCTAGDTANIEKTSMRSYWLLFIFILGSWTGAITRLQAQEIDAESYRSIVAALQAQVDNHPSAFPLDSLDDKVQGIAAGLQNVYFGYGERRYTTRTDFHPAMDVGYFPRETGVVKTDHGETREVRAPRSYLKNIYAIQEGLLISAEMKSTGYKIILKHTLEQPYFDSEGRAYHEYFTCYRHVDERSLDYLTLIARKTINDEQATYVDLLGKHVFKAGDLIAFAGFDPNARTGIPRSHLDFSLNLFGDPDKGTNIRRYALNPLLLFPPFVYADPRQHRVGEDGVHAYRFEIDPQSIVPPDRRGDGHFQIEIGAGGLSTDGAYTATRYYALNSIQITVFNGGEKLATYTIDRHQKLGYDTSSYEELDNPDDSKPHFHAPLDEQGDVYQMQAVIPARWLGSIDYDWSMSGSIAVRVASIWDGYLDGHSYAFEFPLEAR
jgi:hypothetical protein